MNKNLLIGLAAAAFIVIFASLFYVNRGQNMSYQEPTTYPMQVTNNVTVVLAEQSESAESGTATLEEIDGKVVVTLSLEGAPTAVSQPAHIHEGACPNPGTVVYPLTSVQNGNSETTLDVTLDDLKEKLPLAVNVHKSAAEAKVYVACGDLSL